MENSPSNKRALVLGIGNTIRKDDGVGVAVVEALERRLSDQSNLFFETMQSGGVDILSSLKSFDLAIIVDAAFMNNKPGEAKWLSIEKSNKKIQMYSSTHSIGVLEALQIVETLPNLEMPDKIIVLGIQVKEVNKFEETLSKEVAEGAKIAFNMILGKLKEYNFLEENLEISPPEF